MVYMVQIYLVPFQASKVQNVKVPMYRCTHANSEESQRSVQTSLIGYKLVLTPVYAANLDLE